MIYYYPSKLKQKIIEHLPILEKYREKPKIENEDFSENVKRRLAEGEGITLIAILSVISNTSVPSFSIDCIVEYFENGTINELYPQLKEKQEQLQKIKKLADEFMDFFRWQTEHPEITTGILPEQAQQRVDIAYEEYELQETQKNVIH